MTSARDTAVSVLVVVIGALVAVVSGWAAVAVFDQHPVISVVLVATVGLGAWIARLGVQMFRDRIR